MGTAKCSICGRMYSQSGLLGDSDKGIQFMASMVKKPICPDCKRAGAFGGGNGGGGSTYADKAAAKIAEEEAENRRIKAAKAAHKAAIQEIKNYVFDDSSDEAYTRSVMNFMDDYIECNPGLFADGDYKKAYKRKIENELKLQKTSNPERAEKLKSLYEEAAETMKKRLRTRFIISGVIVLVAIIACVILMVYSGESVGTGIVAGLFFGLFFSGLPHIGFGKKKEDDE